VIDPDQATHRADKSGLFLTGLDLHDV